MFLEKEEEIHKGRDSENSIGEEEETHTYTPISLLHWSE